jgi:hypothetical protein
MLIILGREAGVPVPRFWLQGRKILKLAALPVEWEHGEQLAHGERRGPGKHPGPLTLNVRLRPGRDNRGASHPRGGTSVCRKTIEKSSGAGQPRAPIDP